MTCAGCLLSAVALGAAGMVGFLAAAGSFGVIPGLTHSSEIVADLRGLPYATSPDTSTLVFGTHFVHERGAAGIMAFPDGGAPHIEGSFFELQSYDLRARGEPAPVAAWDVPARATVTILQVDGREVLLSITNEGSTSLEAVPLDGGSRRAVPVATRDSVLAARRSALRVRDVRPDWSRTRVSTSYGRFLFADGRTREEAVLFALPGTHRGRRIVGAETWPAAWRADDRAQSIHRPWAVTARTGRDSVHVTTTTYVSRPGSAPREYAFRYALSVPDTSREKEQVSAWTETLLVVDAPRLGPRRTTVTRAFAWDEIDRILDPYRRRLRGGMSWPWPTSIHVRIVPTIGPGDSTEVRPMVWRGEEDVAGFDAPPRR